MLKTFKISGTRFFLIDDGPEGVRVIDEAGGFRGRWISEESFRKYHKRNGAEPVSKVSRVDLILESL